MTDEIPDSPEESPMPEKPAAKKTARKRSARKKVFKADEDHRPAAEEDARTIESPAGNSGTPLGVDDATGFETRETESKNARRVSSKRVKPAGDPSGAKDPEGSGESKASDGGEEETIPLIREPAEGDEPAGGGKRRRRRRRRGGVEEPESGESGGRQRPALDPESVASKAWKIYKAEVAEEGLALINDNDARELSRRSFRLAEIFLEEEARRH